MRTIPIIGCLLLLFGCYKTERNCKDFKTGKFYSEVTIEGVVYKSVFERTENLQVEPIMIIKQTLPNCAGSTIAK